MTTIHYGLNNADREMDPSTSRDRPECIQTLRRAIDIARFICARVNEDTSEDPTVTADRFLIDLHLEGRYRGSEPISYGWTRDFKPPHNWVLRGFCKTVSADDHVRAHLLISHILQAWQLAGLVDTIHDERGYMPERDLRSFLDTTTLDAIHAAMDSFAEQLQEAVVDAVAKSTDFGAGA